MLSAKNSIILGLYLVLKSLIRCKYQIWLLLSILVAALYSVSGLKLAFSSAQIIQDDARQYLFWMQQFNDPQLFQNDLITSYFQTVTPLGYSTLYKVVSYLGIDIFFFNKISTLLLGIITTIYIFLVCVEIFSVPLAGFLSSLLLNQNLWMVDDLSSGTPRAYIYLLLLAFIYYLLKNKLILCLLTIGLQGLFYPQAVLISAMVLLIRLVHRLMGFQYADKVYVNTDQKQKRIFSLNNFPAIEIWGLFASLLILLLYATKTSTFSPVITESQAQLLPEFMAGGRSAFFVDNFVQFWLISRRSGLFPIEWQYNLICSYGLSLFGLIKLPHKFPLVKQIKPNLRVLGELLLASVLLFGLAHLFLFKLHLPGRYTHHSLRIILALWDGMAIAILFNFATTKITQRIGNKYQFRIKTTCLILVLLGLLAPFYAVQSYPQRLGYVSGSAPELYQFFAHQPKTSLVATLSKEADFIPSLAGRSVLVAEEYAIPYHQGYYQIIRQRVKDLIAAQYTTKKETLRDFINQYQPDFWLLDNSAFTRDYLAQNPWLQQFQPETTQALQNLKSEPKTYLEIFLANFGDRCTVFSSDQHTVIDPNCLIQTLKIA